jgi:hypothetical protein
MAIRYVVLGVICTVIGSFGCSVPREVTQPAEAEPSPPVKSERIIMHDPESLKDQIHQVDTTMRFVPVQPDTLK